MLSLFHNLYLKKKFAGNYSITVYNHPLPRKALNLIDALESDLIVFSIGLLSSFGFSFLVASYALFIVYEKSSKAKHLQLVSGLHKSAYWLANLIWDLLTSLVPIIAAMLLFMIFQFVSLPHFSGLNLFAVFCLFILLCWAEIPLVYLISIPFENIYTAYTSIFILTSMTTLTCMSLIYLINVVSSNKMAADVLHYVFLLNPSYGLASGLSDIYYNHVVSSACKESSISLAACRQDGSNYYEHPFEFERPGIGVTLIYLFIEGFIFALLTLLVDHGNDIKQFFERRRKWTLLKHHEHARRKNEQLSKNARPVSAHIRPRSVVVNKRSQNVRLSRSVSLMQSQMRQPGGGTMNSFPEQDPSVRKERRHINHMLRTTNEKKLESYSLMLSEVSKQYSSGLWQKLKETWTEEEPPLPAVSGINLKVKEKECFGLAGFNGAGKTTLFKILTGDISSTSGVATICGLNIRTHFFEVRKNLGYCPQFDALVERMTGREILTMYARIKGLDKDTILQEVREKLDLLSLNEHADKLCWTYSGGNRRKLSAAIALIGDPKVVLLDEPTTGMDIETRGRFIEMLKNLIKEKKTSIILTSHSMGECETLCNRIGILIKGEFRCIGSTQELKNKYGEQKTKIVIRVKRYVPTPNPSENGSQLSVVSRSRSRPRLQRTPSMVMRLQSIGRAISTVAVKPSAQVHNDTIEEVSDEDDEEEEDEELEEIFDEVDEGGINGNAIDFGQAAIPVEVEEEDNAEEEEDYVNKYLVDVCKRFESEFGIARVQMIGCDADEVSFKLPRTFFPLSKIFKIMERIKKDTGYILNYSVTQSTLEQVYNFFANEKRQQDY